MSEETTPEEMESERAELWQTTIEEALKAMEFSERDARQKSEYYLRQADTTQRERLKLESALYKAGLRT